MLTVKKAVQKASATLKEVFTELGEEQPEKLRVEEVELSDDDKHWFVTFSFLDMERTKPLSFIGELSSPAYRIYKKIKLDAETGEFRGLRDPGL